MALPCQNVLMGDARLCARFLHEYYVLLEEQDDARLYRAMR